MNILGWWRKKRRDEDQSRSAIPPIFVDEKGRQYQYARGHRVYCHGRPPPPEKRSKVPDSPKPESIVSEPQPSVISVSASSHSQIIAEPHALFLCPSCGQGVRATKLESHLMRVHQISLPQTTPLTLAPPIRRRKHARRARSHKAANKKRTRRTRSPITAFRGGYSDRGPGGGWHRTSNGWRKG
jgi:hypothetical protein